MSSDPIQLPPIDLAGLAQNARVLFQPFTELLRGVQDRRIPWSTCLSFGSLAGLPILLKWDGLIFRKCHMFWLYPLHPWPNRLYCAATMLSGFYFWGLYQTYRARRKAKALTKVFLDAKLKSATGSLPNVVRDVAIDTSSCRMTLQRNGITVSQFREASDAVASGLGCYIDDISENRENDTVDIFYSYSELTKNILFPGIKDVPENGYIAGFTRQGPVNACLEEVPHLLVAGVSGGGKSTFLRQFITAMYLKNPAMKMTLIDLKGGLEFQIFDGLDRVSVVQTVADASLALVRAVKMLEDRMKLLHANNCKDIETYQAKAAHERVLPEGWNHSGDLNRHLVVIDEAYDLFRVAPGASSDDVQKARAAANTIAQKGRAVGIHIVIATQRPDKNAVDPQTKANLSAKVCFRMENNTSSMTVLDNGKAADLPKINGRAIWQCGFQNVEIQTPNLTVEAAEKLLEPKRAQKPVEAVATEAQEPSVDRGAHSDLASKL